MSSVPFHILLLLQIFRSCNAFTQENPRKLLPFCQSFDCGNGLNISYPFWLRNDTKSEHCGHEGFQLSCENGIPVLTLSVDTTYYILNIDYVNKILTIVGTDVYHATACPVPRQNFTFWPWTSAPPFYLTPNDTSVTILLNCSAATYLGEQWGCAEKIFGQRPSYVFPEGELPKQSDCGENVVVPVLQPVLEASNLSDVDRVLRQGFEVAWNSTMDGECRWCELSGGFCGRRNINSSYGISNQFVCYCSNGRAQLVDCHGRSINSEWIGFSVATLLLGSCVLAGLIFMICQCRQSRKKSKSTQKVENFLKNCEPMSPKRYRYADIKRMTKCFKFQLGQGGYGSVYKGWLEDGRKVAVKVLTDSKGNGEEFINEVACIGRTYHVNIVTLLGFCSKGSKRALVYEFMPNGSLERFIYIDEPRTTRLEWEKLYNISLGIARGLEYLHLGCTTKILHFDIKPHNILLDKDFCPKISDFGLAKLCPAKDGSISVHGTRGTVGYIAPEVFCRNFGGISSKSDVYSYGMMVLEIVGGRKNLEVRAENTSELYFPHWIYKHSNLVHYLKLCRIADDVEEELARKMILVGLWCIQTLPSNRPSISRVVDMLEGSIADVPMPPKPYPSSPPRSCHGSPLTASPGGSSNEIDD
ncbi:LEAF RUST 10 DISEASE-RESISTANCE LOCUS RECEPTOR-LIKE PROTEIN KINASE-like 2.1 [Cocos nucifera]|uniref:non-specific serine/threonine protein kinase n=1 Tax=Cocos nucifera TaxID=13894 RepID=A0A8K0HWC1_COCNU|nr:LEAF RUST 10 DISEASE-RESISTANCE LOCUS RECEPTOR-LIKE PROTEIN KINASE-like 2.1 [Cocos nucifera]